MVLGWAYRASSLTAGNRKVNHALHMVAFTQIRNPGTEGRISFERKVSEGKTKKGSVASRPVHLAPPLALLFCACQT